MILHSWGRYPVVEPARIERMVWRDHRPPFASAGAWLAYGLGRSYGDVCLNEDGVSILTHGLDRIISFNEERGIVRCEAGVSLETLIRFALPRGFFPATTPGTQLITIGGAVANDVHGKNHHRVGSFGNTVLGLHLLRSDGTLLWCTPSENSELFSATIGGLGLTGLIIDVELQLRRVRGPWIDAETFRFHTLREFLHLSRELAPRYEYTVAWVDGTSSGAQLGRGLFYAGNHSTTTLYDRPEKRKFHIPFPFDAPDKLLTRSTISIFNSFYWRKTLSDRQASQRHYTNFFYPLDTIEDWNRLYGKRGFFQHQSVIPFENGEETLRELLSRVSHYGKASFLAVLKTFGSEPSRGMLSFPRPGITLALDFANEGEETLQFLNSLDEVVAQAGGALYPAKDARMSREMFQLSFPRLEEFKKWKDPLFSSSLWRRLGGSNDDQ